MAETELLPLDAVPWRGLVALVGRALRRHWLVMATLTLLFTGVGVAAAVYLPRTYAGETRLLVRKGTSTMAAVTDPRRAIVPGFDHPAQAAVELALSRPAIEAIVDNGDLVTHFKNNRPPLLALVHRLRTAVMGPLSAEDERDAVIGLVQARLRVSLAEEVVRMRVEWTDAEGVERVLTHAVNAYLAERTRLDVESLQQSHAILERAVASMRQEVAAQVVAFQRARARVMGAGTAAVRSAPVASVRAAQVRDRLLERRAYREELERQRRQRQVALEVQLAQQQETLGPAHPDRIATERALEGLAGDDDALRRARAEESSALDEYIASGGALDIFGVETEESMPFDPTLRPDDDPTVIAARAELRIRVDGYQDLTMRLENARLELETARAALAYRYMITQPPERPRKPVAPAVPLILVGALVAGLGAGLLLAITLRIRAESRAAGIGMWARLATLDAAPVAVAAS